MHHPRSMPISSSALWTRNCSKSSLADPARHCEPSTRKKKTLANEPKKLKRVDYAIANDGEASRITLTAADGQELTLELSYRELGRFIEPLHTMAGDMRERLLKNGEKLKAEVLAELAEARTVEVVIFAVDENTGEQVMSVEGRDLGILALRLPDGVA